MKGIREEDVRKLSDVKMDDGRGFERVLADMIGQIDPDPFRPTRRQV